MNRWGYFSVVAINFVVVLRTKLGVACKLETPGISTMTFTSLSVTESYILGYRIYTYPKCLICYFKFRFCS